MSFNDIKTGFMAWLRRPQVWGFFVSMAVMAIVSLLFFAPNNFNGDTLSQHDMQQGAANGAEAQEYYQATGEKALWTNALFSGMPTFQISPEYESNALFTWLNDVYGLWLPSPSNLLFMMMLGMLICCYCLRMRWWYALLAALAWGLSSYFIIIIGAGHIWKFLALTYMPPTIGAVVMAYRGRWLWGASLLALFAMMELNANHPQITYYSLFIMAGLAIAYLVVAIRNKAIKGWLIGSAACLVAGALALGANAPSLYNTYEYSKETKRAQSELTPLAKANADSQDAPSERPTGGLPKSEIGGWSNLPSESFSLLIPNIKGGASIRPEKGVNQPLTLDKVADADQLAKDEMQLTSQMLQYFGGKGFTNGPFYVGAIIVALFLLGCLIVPGPLKWTMVVMTLFSIMLAMGNHFEALTDFMIYNVPMYNKFRAAETALVIAAFCMPLLGALALQKLMTAPGAWLRYRYDIMVAFGLPVLICLAAALFPALFGEPFSTQDLEQINQVNKAITEQNPGMLGAFNNGLEAVRQTRLDMVSDEAWRSLLFLLMGAGVVVGSLFMHLKDWMCAAGVGFLTLADLYSVDKRYVSSDSFADAQFAAIESGDPLAADAIDEAIMKDKGYYRVMDYADFGGARRSKYHHMIGGYHAAKLNRYNDLIERQLMTDRNPEILDMLNAKYLIFVNQDQQGNKFMDYQQNPYALGAAWFVDSITYVDNADAEMAALDNLHPATHAVADRKFSQALGGSDVPARAQGDFIKLDKYTPNQLTYSVSTRNGGLAVFSEVWFPWGWKATVDGQPAQLGRVNYALRAMRVPAGNHTIVMTFDPDSIHTTATVAYTCVTFIYLLLALALFVYVIGNENNPLNTAKKQKADSNRQ